MALTAQQEAFVVTLFNNRDKLTTIVDYMTAARQWSIWRTNLRGKKQELAAGSITREQYNTWLAANREPAIPNNPLDRE